MSTLHRLAWIGVLAVIFSPCAAAAKNRAPAKVQPIPVPRPVPPVKYIVKEMTAKGAVAGKLAKVAMTVRVETLDKGRLEVPLFATNAAIAKVRVSSGVLGPDAYVLRDAKRVLLCTEGKGEFKVTMEIVVPVTGDKRHKSLTMPLVVATQSTLTLAIHEPDIEVKAKPELGIETRPMDKGTEVVVYGGTASEVELTWTRKAPEKKLEAIVFAEQDALVEITRGACRVDSVITYSILQSSIDELRVGLPDDCNLLNVGGDDIRSWDVADDAGRKTLVVSLLNPAKDKYELRLKLEKVVPKIPVELPVPQIEVLGVEREKGAIAIAAAKGVQVEATKKTEVVQVDVKDASKPLLDMSQGREIHLCFRYLKRPFDIEVKADEIKAKVAAEFQTAASVGLSSMRVNSTINYTIRDAGVFQFKVGVGPDTKLVSVDGENINNWEFDDKTHVLQIDMRSKAEKSYALKIELEKELKAQASAAGGIRTVQDAQVPSLQAIDVGRQRGYIVVSALPGMKVEPARTDNASQVDVKELPESLRPTGDTVAIGYRYIKEGYQIAVNVSEVQAEVTADVMHLVTVAEKNVQFETVVNYRIRKAGIFQLRVKVPKSLRRHPTEGDNIDDETYDDATETLTINLKSKVERQFSLTVRAEMQLDEGLTDDVDKVKELTIPEIHPLDVEKERGHIGVQATTTVRLKKKPGEVTGLRDIDIKDLPAELIGKAPKLSLAFHYFEPGWKLVLLAEPIKPRVTVETFNFVSLGEDLMAASASAKFNIQHAGVSEFMVKMPQRATNVDIEGEEIKHKEKVKAATATAAAQTWKITLHAKRQGSYSLFFTFEIKLEKGKGPYAYNGIQIKDVMKEVERETGYLAVAAREDLEVSLPKEDPYESLTPVDEKEIPSDYLQGITLPILLSFRYLSHPYVLRLNVERHDSAEVVVAVIEAAKLDTSVTEEGETITDLVAEVRNSREQYLTLQLPAQARIWHAFVGGQSVTPLTETLQGKTVTKLPIAQVGKAEKSFEVRLRYSTAASKLGAMGTLNLEFPTVNLIIMRLGWTVGLPEGYDLVWDRGTLRRIVADYAFESQLQNLAADLSVDQMRKSTRRSYARAKQQRQSQMLYNKMAIANVQQAESQRAASGKTSVTKSIYTGSKPAMPKRFLFQSLIVPPGRPATIKSQYVKESIGMPSQVAVLLVLAGLLCMGWTRLRAPVLPRLGLYIALALVFLGIRTMTEGAYASQLTWIIRTIVIVTALMMAWSCAQWVKERWRAARSSGASEQ